MFRYVHTNIIAKDAAKLIAFYTTALGCTRMGQTRDLRGPWLDGLTGLPGAHIVGEHLLLPGYTDDHPTLEIFSYDNLRDTLMTTLRTVILLFTPLSACLFALRAPGPALRETLVCPRGLGSFAPLLREAASWASGSLVRSAPIRTSTWPFLSGRAVTVAALHSWTATSSAARG